MSVSQPSGDRRCKVCGTPLGSGVAGEVCLCCALGHALESGAAPTVASAASAGERTDAGTSFPPVAGEPPFRQHFGDYEILEEIARGGMGAVYKARQISLDRIVAVKMLLFGPLASKEYVQRFRTEATAAGSLQHPNIVSIHEVGIHQGQQYLVMDFVNGPPLSRLVSQQPLPARRAAAYLKTIAEAVHYAHEHGILHRDLKPSNVLIDESDQPRITDFGLAKRLGSDSSLATYHSSLTLSGQLLGSPNYMPPEQAAAKRGKVSRRSDVYALGGTLYHLLTGRAPFVTETLTETLHLLLDTEPVSPRMLNPSVPRDLETVCLKCLEKEPDKRYPTAQAVADELGRFLRDEPITARPIGPVAKAWRWCRRKPLVASLTTATALAILIGFVGVAWKGQQARTARDLAQRRLYASRMNQAFRAWDVGNLDVARALLDTQRPPPGAEDLRGSDWRWLWALCQSEAKAVLPTQGEWQLYAAEPSPDGRWVATAGYSKDIVIYDLETGAKLRTLTGHKRLLTSGRPLAFSPDGQRLASASGGLLQSGGKFELLLWDLASGGMTNLEERSASYMAVAFSLDGRRLATASLDGTVGLWDPQTHSNLATLRGHKGQVYTVAFTPDSRSLYTGGEDGTVRHWDVMTRREAGAPIEHALPVGNVAVSPDGQTLAIECWDNYLHLRDLPSGKTQRLRYTPAERCPGSHVFSPNGRLLAFSTGNNVRIWDLEANRERTVLRGSTGNIVNLRFLPDGRHLVSACEFGRPLLWDIERPEKLPTLRGFREGVRSMTVSADSRWLAVGSGDFYDPQRPAEVLVFDLASQQPLLPPLEHPQSVDSLSLTAEGKLLATGCRDGSVRVFTLPGGELVRILTNAVTNKRGNLVFSPDGQTLVTSSAVPRQFTLWNTATWEAIPLLKSPPGEAQNLAYSPDGALLVTPMGQVGYAIVWNMPAGTTNTVIPFRKHAREAAFSADGTLLALDTHRDIGLFSVKTWKQLGTFKGHEHVINRIAFAPDGKILASVSNEGTVRLWSVPGGEETAVLYDHLSPIEAVAFTPDGHWLISGSRDKTVKLRRIPSFDEIATAERSEATRR